MQKCSVGFILALKCASKKNIFTKIVIDDVPIGQVELLRIRSKIGTFANVVDSCPRHKLKFIDNYTHEHWYKCVEPFSLHKQLLKMNLHEITLPEFYSIYLGQQICMKSFKRFKDNVVASTITIENEVEMDQKEQKDEISVETAHGLVDKTLEPFDCSLKNVK